MAAFYFPGAGLHRSTGAALEYADILGSECIIMVRMGD